MRIGILRVVIGTALLFGPSLAYAQRFNAIGGNKPAAPTGPQVQPPPALPGASSNSGAAAPPSRIPTDMDPTDALFDAINRGDIGAARDAISRGADLNGHNILGMSPMELSVDLGRNDISFLLLSMRGAEDGRSTQAAAVAATSKPLPTRQARQLPPHPTARVAAPAPTQTARLFSGDGGTPNPNAGFLGFDSSRR
jgi:hypothetical protein